METLSEAGEFGLIDHIRRFIRKRGVGGVGLVLGAGDDTAAVTPTPGYDLLITCDALVEGRHFLKNCMSPHEIGGRAMAANISDIGAMGGLPRWALISLGLKKESLVRDILDMYQGFLDQLNPFNAVIAGGNITRSDQGPFIDITLIGEVAKGRMVSRSGARQGDAILVTGFPGQAAEGLDLLLSGEEEAMNSSEALALVEAYKNPRHRAVEGRAIANTGLANSMIDISDGMLGDLGHICQESNVGAQLHEDALPVSEALRWAAARKGVAPLSMVTRESDDYELIITCPPARAEALAAAVARVSSVPITRVGWITDSTGKLDLILRDGARASLKAEGWDHFS